MFLNKENIILGIKEIGKKYDASPAQIATSWAISKGTLPIIGVTKVHQFEEAAQTSKIKLINDEVASLKKIADEANVHTLRE